MFRIKIYLLLSVILFFTHCPIPGYGQSSASFQIKKWNLSTLAGSAASLNFKLSESEMGGMAIGKSSSSSFVLNGGMFVTSLGDSMLIGDNFPQWFILKQNYPNPFNPSTTITYDLPKASDVTIRIYNSLGQTIKMFDLGHRLAGVHQIKWNGRDDFGNPFSSGIYYYQIFTKDFTDVKKMILVR